jgi:CBS domain containing-hemolysin-like protein
MPLPLLVFTIAVGAGLSLLFSTLTYALRDLSRVRLSDQLERRGNLAWLDSTVEHQNDLVFITALFRLIFNTLTVLTILDALYRVAHVGALAFWAAALLGLLITFFSSVALPHALAESTGSAVVAMFARPLHALRAVFTPLTQMMDLIQTTVQTALGPPAATETEQIEQEILSVVEEGEKEGVVDQQERVMIESVIEFKDTVADEIMTPRAEVVGIEAGSTLEEVRQTIVQSGHSRIPVYKGTLDQVVGILYARDMLHHLGSPADRFDVTAVMRPAFFVPQSKLLRDLLGDFRLQKIHIAVVLDEYGGTAGVVTIEDILEQLVGDISDEHEPVEPAMFQRINEQTSEADARIRIDELNRLTGLDLPEDAGYESLGGFVTTTLGQIPQTGTTFEQVGAKFTVLDADRQKVKRVKIEQVVQQAAEVGTQS